MTPWISIIIPVFNRKNELKICLAKLIEQVADRCDIEIIVVDNNSTEDITSVMKEFKYPIRVLHQSIIGAAAARNLGAKTAQGTCLVFLDSDTSVTHEWLRAATIILEELRNNGELETLFAGGRIQITPSSNRLVSMLDQQSLNQGDLISKSGFAASAHLWVSKELFLLSGGFDETKAVCEDYFFCRSVTALGAPLHYWPEVAVLHPAQTTLNQFFSRLQRNCFAEVITRQANGQQPVTLFLRAWLAHTIIEPYRILIGASSHQVPLHHRLPVVLVRMIRPWFILQALVQSSHTHETTMKALMK